MNLDYLVLYVRDPAASRDWYSDALGLHFTREQHNGGTVHYSAEIGGTVLELYPAGDKPVTRTRIGLTVPDPYGVGPEPTTVADPDGTVIEVRAASA